MKYIAVDEDDLYDDDDFEDEDDFDEDDEDDDSDDEDLYDTLEYLHTCQTMTKREIISDIIQYLKKYQPEYKIVRKKED